MPQDVPRKNRADPFFDQQTGYELTSNIGEEDPVLLTEAQGAFLHSKR